MESDPAWGRAERDMGRGVNAKQVQKEKAAIVTSSPGDPGEASTESDLECWGGGWGAPRRAHAFNWGERPWTQRP